MARPPPAGLEEAVRQLSTYERWAWPERMSDEDPKAGAAQQVVLVLCGRVSTYLRAACSSPQQAVAALAAVQEAFGSEIALATRLREVLSVEAGCILTTGEAAADQGIAVVADLLSTYTQLEKKRDEHFNALADQSGPRITGHGLGKLLLPTLLECILGGTTRSWECDWETLKPLLQPIHDLALDLPLLEKAASFLLRLVRECAPQLLPQPDSDLEDEDVSTRTIQKAPKSAQEPSPRCLYSLAVLAQEIYDGLVAEGIHDAHAEEISEMVCLQSEVLQRLSCQARAEGIAPNLSRQAQAERMAPKQKVGSVVKSAPVPIRQRQTPRTPSPKRATAPATPPRPTGSSRRSSGPTPGSVRGSSRGRPRRSEALAVEPKCSTAPPDFSSAIPQSEDSLRSLLEELSMSCGAEELASCLMGRAEKAAAVIGKSTAESSEENAAAGKLVDLASFLRTFLELSQEGRNGVLAQLGRIIKLLLQGGSWSDKWRYSLHGMVELVTHPAAAKEAATNLWTEVAECPSVDEEQFHTAGYALAVGSLATELEGALCQQGETAREALANMNCLKLSAQMHLRWVRQLVLGPFGKQPNAALGLGRRAKQVQNQKSPKAMLSATSSSESEAELSEDILSDDVSAPSVASGDRASDLEDFIDWSAEHRFGLLRREGSPPRGPASSSLTSTGVNLSDGSRKDLAPQVQEFYNSKLVPDWEARIQSLLLKRPAPALPSKLATDKVTDAEEQPTKKPRHLPPTSSGLRRSVA